MVDDPKSNDVVPELPNNGPMLPISDGTITTPEELHPKPPSPNRPLLNTRDADSPARVGNVLHAKGSAAIPKSLKRSQRQEGDARNVTNAHDANVQINTMGTKPPLAKGPQQGAAGHFPRPNGTLLSPGRPLLPSAASKSFRGASGPQGPYGAEGEDNGKRFFMVSSNGTRPVLPGGRFNKSFDHPADHDPNLNASEHRDWNSSHKAGAFDFGGDWQQHPKC